MKPYTCSYVFDGEIYQFQIMAASAREAEARIKALRRSARCEGEVEATGTGKFGEVGRMQ